MSSKSQPLLSHQNARNNNQSLLKTTTKKCLSNHLCLPSKAAILLILWTAWIGTTQTLITTGVEDYTMTAPHSYEEKISIIVSVLYAFFAVMMIIYPVSGFIADFCCGRYKIIMISVNILTVATLLVCPTTLLIRGEDLGIRFNYDNLFKGKGTTVLILSIFATFIYIIGLIGYQANYIQLGLDQLHEAQSEYLGLFVHYTTWGFNIGSLISVVVFDHKNYTKQFFLNIFPLIFPPVILILLIITCWKRHWFHAELPQNNPYKTVYKVLNFARKHRYALQRSAYTYSDDYIPTRIDFAKERYGGPFTTEEVENVKTLARIILLLLSLGPIYLLHVPASQYIFPLYAYHTQPFNASLTNWSRLVKDGLLINLTSTCLFPIYIWLVYSLLRKRMPKMLLRLGIGIILSLLGVVSMLIIDLVGHSNTPPQHSNHTSFQCMFKVTSINYTQEFTPLNMNWFVLIPPSLLLGIGSPIVTATTIEFISAQSPHSMRSLLVGINFAICGFFYLLGYITALPFSITTTWINEPKISCGSVYLLFTTIIGLVGLILFSVAAKCYKYRKRDDENFNQRDIEEIYTRYLSQPGRPDLSDNNSDD